MIVKTRSLARLALELSSSGVEWLMSDDGKRKLCFRWWACRDLPSTISLTCFKQEKIEQRVSTRSTSIFACSMHDIRARARVIHSWSACRSVANVAARSESQNTSCQYHKQQRVGLLLRPRSGPSTAAHTRTTGVKEQQVVYWANIEKRNQINTKNYWK